MSDYAVRRIGMAPCTEGQYTAYCKREKIVNSGDAEALKKYDEEVAKRKAAKAAGANGEKPEGGSK